VTDLARLVVALEAQTAKYQQGLDNANRKLNKFSRDQQTLLGSIDKQWKSFGSGIKAGLVGLAGAVTFKAIIDATAEAEHAFALLDNAVKASGGAAGFTTQQLADLAGELQKFSTYDDEAIMGAEQLLLRFQSIRGVNFTGATQATLDLAAALGKDLGDAAMLVGKALESPEKGMTQLARSGVVFSQQQQKVIKDLVDTGQTAKAQGIIIEELEKRYGGAALAARDTFGGAIQGLKNSFNDLLEGKGGMEDATAAINSLTDVLNSDEVKKGFETIITGFATLIEWTAKAVAAIGAFAKDLGEFFGELVAGPAGMTSEQLSKRIEDLQRLRQQSIDARGANLDATALEQSAALETSKQLVKDYDAQIQKLTALKKLQDGLGTPRSGSGATGPVIPVGAPKPLDPRSTMAAYDPRKDPALADIRITAGKDPLGLETPMRKFYDELDKESQTTTEKQLAQFAQLESALNELYASGKIGADEYTKRFNEGFDELVPKVEVTAKKIGDKLVAQFDYVGKAIQDLVHQSTDIIEGGIEDAMHGHFDNILKNFEHLIDQMVAKSLASDIAGALFGQRGGGSGEGFLGGALDWLGKNIFSGSRDVGGSGERGRVYKIGTGAQPEYFAPSEPGTFHPRGDGMGWGGKTTNNFYVQGKVDERTIRQIDLNQSRRQRAASRLA
jgi:hypothetical protein